jgi:sulfotransferase famil protein
VSIVQATVSTPTTHCFFFIHVMKTAGTTLARHLQQQFAPQEFYPSRGFDWELPTDVEPYINIPRLLALPDERRDQVRMYAGHFPYLAADLLAPNLRKLTLLRDPVDRTVSVLKHFKRREERFRSSTLETIYEDSDISRWYVRNYQTRVFSLVPADQAITVQVPVDIDDSRLELAKENLSRVEFVGLTETFGEFVEDLRTQLGWWPNGVDPSERANKSSEPWSISPALRQRITDDNPHDTAFYRFAQELVARRLEAAVQPRSDS